MPMFKDLFSSHRVSKSVLDGTEPTERLADMDSGPETVPIQMNLEERMAFRREILFDSISGTLSSHRIAPHTYRCKVMRTDKRGHCFVVMLDMCESFLASPAGQHDRLAAIASDLAAQCEAENHLLIAGVYWRLDLTLRHGKDNLDKQTKSELLIAAGENNPMGNTRDEIAQFDGDWKKSSSFEARQNTYKTSRTT